MWGQRRGDPITSFNVEANDSKDAAEILKGGGTCDDVQSIEEQPTSKVNTTTVTSDLLLEDL